MSSSITSSHAHHQGANTSSSASSSASSCAKSPVTLDLHGCTKPQAIQKLTTFFDQIRSNHYNNNSNKKTSYPVTIITGSGKHSTHGPVLRQAVQHLLEKRQMTFHLNHHGGKGSFHVDALSGIDLMDRALIRQTSSKILVVNRNGDEEDDEGHVRLFQRCINRNMEYSRQRGQDSEITATVTDVDNNNNHDNADDDILPTPSEVARDDDLIQQVKMISQTEAMQMKSLEIKEKNEFQKAIHESESVHVQKQMQMQDDLELTKVLVLSKEQHEQKLKESQDQEQKMLTNVLEMSLQEEKKREERERLELEKVLALSEVESLVVKGQGQGQDEDKEDLVLMQVLECSKRQEGQHMDFEEQMKLALEESLLLSL
mmetsp:Transcript_12290/g.23026  ORF Transcript_12290/g.23026 Transcript_12290/m.23026 type:complete len:372 (+) Transcript_12290:128-1243(+)